MKRNYSLFLKRAAAVLAVSGVTLLIVWFMGLDLDYFHGKSDDSFTFEDMHLRVWDEGQVRWEIWAEHVKLSPDRNIYEIDNIYKGILYRKDKKYRFSAAAGTYDFKGKKFELRGLIEFKAPDGDYFKSRNMYWNGGAELLRLPNRAEIYENGNLMYGDYFEASGPELRNFTIRGNVAAKIPNIDSFNKESLKKEVKESGVDKKNLRNMLLLAQRLEYDGKSKIMRCYATLTPGEASAVVTQNPVMPRPGAPGAPGAQIQPVIPIQPQTGGQLPPPINVPGQPPAPGAPGALPPPIVPPPGTIIGATPGIPVVQFNSPLVQPPFAQVVTLITQNYEIAGAEIVVMSETKLARAVGTVRIIRKAQKPDKKKSATVKALQKRDAYFLSREVLYYWKEGRMEVPGPVSMQQREVTTYADSAILNIKLEQAHLRGNVVMNQPEGDWLLKEDIVKKDAEDKTKEIAKQATTMNCSTLDIDYKNEDIVATGRVHIVQKERDVVAATAMYTGSKKTWQIFGDVKVLDKKDFYAAPTFTYNEDSGEVNAPSGAYVEIIPKDKQHDDLMDYFRERDGKDFKESDYDNEKVYVRGDDLRYDKEKDVLYVNGHGSFKYRDLSLTGDHITVDYDHDTAHAEGNAVFADKDSTITGDKSEMDWKNHNFTSAGKVLLSYKGKKAQGDEKAKDPFDLKCARLDYNTKTKKGVADGNPVITSRGRRIASAHLTLDADANIYVFTGGVKMHQDNGDWLRDKDYIDADDKQSWTLAEKPTDVSCDSARIESDRDYILLDGDVKILQKEKRVYTDKLTFDGKAKRLLLEGAVRMSQDNGEWLFEGEFIDKDEDEDVKKRARDKIDVTADYLESLYGEKQMRMTGGITVRQGKSEAAGNSLWYYGNDKLTVIEGSVIVNDEDGRKLNAGRIVYDGKKKEMEAFNSIRGTGYADKKKQ